MTHANKTARYGAAVLLGLALFAWMLPRDVQAGVQEGATVEPFQLEKRGGGTFRFPQDAEGKTVFLNFWASWCPECRIELPQLAKMSEAYREQPLTVLYVNMDRKRKAVEKYLEKLKLDLFVLYDTNQEVVRTFNPVGVPASYLIGSDKKVKKAYFGFDQDSIGTYKHDIEALLGKEDRDASSLGAKGRTEDPKTHVEEQHAPALRD